MRIKLILFQLLYYILTLLCYAGLFYGTAWLFHSTNVGVAIAVTYGLLFFAIPALVASLMRFSLLKCYVDPFAAALAPLFLYFVAVIGLMERETVRFSEALSAYNQRLTADGSLDWLFFVGMFLFGLAASFSFARREGKSVSYRLLSRVLS